MGIYGRILAGCGLVWLPPAVVYRHAPAGLLCCSLCTCQELGPGRWTGWRAACRGWRRRRWQTPLKLPGGIRSLPASAGCGAGLSLGLGTACVIMSAPPLASNRPHTSKLRTTLAHRTRAGSSWLRDGSCSSWRRSGRPACRAGCRRWWLPRRGRRCRATFGCVPCGGLA